MTTVFNFNTSEKEAAVAIGVNYQTLQRQRQSGKIPSYVFTKTGYKTVRYCLPLLRDWQIDPDDLEAHARAFDRLQSTRASSANFLPSSIEDKKQESEDV